ncbi:unnamed protein product [Schistocephalus solidus]|uniref:Uncharacterized protein n=1 Tax=Schistocephalus solidus TaxID=70667 RepID=A0A183TAC4_SCHSO|nr:unnamed protein product [Schistocephalus solidus]
MLSKQSKNNLIRPYSSRRNLRDVQIIRGATRRNGERCWPLSSGATQGGHQYFQRDQIRLQERLAEMDAGCTFFWSGHPKAERRDADVAFANQTDIVGHIACLP